jgi:hypothetical protein
LKNANNVSDLRLLTSRVELLPKRRSRREKIKGKDILVYVDFSNFIGELNNILNTRIFQIDEDRYIELSKILAKIIHNIFVTLPGKLSV